MNLVLCAIVGHGCAGGEDPDASGFGTTPMSAGGTGTMSSTTAPGTTSSASTDEPSTGGSSASASAGMSTSEATTGTTTDGSSTEALTDGTTTGSTSAGTGECPDGTIQCPCYGNNTCNAGLACDAGICVPEAAPVCGDGMIAGMEECDNGSDNADTAVCKSDCTTQKCGDGFVGPGEACDDGNMVDNDACSNACVAASCGDGVTQMGEACDDANAVSTDACINCKAAACGDTYVQAGVEECDDGNVGNGDGCSAACKIEVPQCGGNFTTSWCIQNGTNQQYTRCESVGNGGKTCNNPFVKYGSAENGIPADHGGNNYSAWCTQLGFAGFSGQVAFGSRSCDAPQGRLFGCAGYDEGVWHWCDWQDGWWLNQQLDYHQCNDGQQITSITCQ